MAALIVITTVGNKADPQILKQLKLINYKDAAIATPSFLCEDVGKSCHVSSFHLPVKYLLKSSVSHAIMQI